MKTEGSIHEKENRAGSFPKFNWFRVCVETLKNVEYFSGGFEGIWNFLLDRDSLNYLNLTAPVERAAVRILRALC